MRNHKNVSQESNIKSVLLPNLRLNTEKRVLFYNHKRLYASTSNCLGPYMFRVGRYTRKIYNFRQRNKTSRLNLYTVSISIYTRSEVNRNIEGGHQM